MALCWFLCAALWPNASWADEYEGSISDAVQWPIAPGTEAQKITLGEVEDVVLAPLGVRFAARIDTGAEISSLDARDVVVRDKHVEFRLGSKYGGSQLQLPFVEWRYVRTSMGTEKRPVVALSICLGPRLFHTIATLRDRSEMSYPFLVGRSALKDGFIVDTSRSRATQPNCRVSSLASKQPAASTQAMRSFKD
jgi:hypothetical protein